jgi:hypothetical protein
MYPNINNGCTCGPYWSVIPPGPCPVHSHHHCCCCHHHHGNTYTVTWTSNSTGQQPPPDPTAPVMA